MAKNIPLGPWANPRLEEGLHAARATNIRHIQYGADNGSMLELSFRLEQSGLSFASRLYLPAQFSATCQHRLWYLCQALGVEGYELMEKPDIAVGRRLVLDVTTIHPTKANHGNPYSDVKRFLPSAENQQDIEEPAENTVG